MTTRDVARIINPRELTELYNLLENRWPTPEEVDANYRRINLVNYNAFYKGDFEMKNDKMKNKIKWTVRNIETTGYPAMYGTHPEIRMHLVGNIESIQVGSTVSSIADHVANLLNENVTVHVPVPVPEIKKVHFNPPATVVLWEDGTKTVVKAQEGDDYDPEKGLAMAISKKALGNKGNFNEVFKKWLPEETSDDLGQYVEDIPTSFGPLADTPKVVLWKKEDDSNGN